MPLQADFTVLNKEVQRMNMRNRFMSICKKYLKSFTIFALLISMLLSTYISASAQEPLSTGDTFIYVDVYSVKADGKYTGTFFKHNNSLYIEKETLLNMADLVEYKNSLGEIISFARKDEPNAEFVTADYETFTYKDVVYYPFIEAMTDLCINATFNRKKEVVIAIPAKSIWDIYSAVEPMYDNVTYKMWEWQNAEEFDSETSRVVAQATNIGRKLYALPAVAYDYASGNATYEQYRSALWGILAPEAEIKPENLKAYKEEMYFLSRIEFKGEISKMDPFTDDSETGYKTDFYNDNSVTAKLASWAKNGNTLLQVEDNTKIIQYYSNLENMNESIVRGVELVNRSGLADNASLNKAFEEVVEINSGEKSMWNMVLSESGDGLVELLIGKSTNVVREALDDFAINGTVVEFWANTMDYFGEKLLGEDYTSYQVDATISATSNLHIQDAARRSFYYYKVIYETTKNTQKKIEALQNMKDVTLIYMLAGHNAWKSLSFDSDLSESSNPTVKEMAKHVESLLQYNANDFSVYQNAVDTKYGIAALGESREQHFFFFSWDETWGNEIGGLEFSLEGKDADGKGFLYKKIFSHLYYQQDGMQVGNIRTNSRTDSYSRTVEVLEPENICEIVIRPGQKGQNVLDAGMHLYTGTKQEEYTKGLDKYLVRERDGTVIYRIPVPMDSGVSTGEALATTRVDSKFDFTTTIGTNSKGQQTGADASDEPEYPVKVVTPTYVPQGPFDGECKFENDIARYIIRYNSKILNVDRSYFIPSVYVYYVCDEVNQYVYAVSELKWTDMKFEEYYQEQKNFYDEDSFSTKEYPIEDIKEIRLNNGAVRYFTTKDRMSGGTGDTVYCFLYDLGNGEKIQGYWHLESNEGKVPDTFEAFLLELLSNVEIEKKK